MRPHDASATPIVTPPTTSASTAATHSASQEDGVKAMIRQQQQQPELKFEHDENDSFCDSGVHEDDVVSPYEQEMLLLSECESLCGGGAPSSVVSTASSVRQPAACCSDVQKADFNFNYSRFRAKIRSDSAAAAVAVAGQVDASTTSSTPPIAHPSTSRVREKIRADNVIALSTGAPAYTVADRYLFAIKEDLAAWFAHLYPAICGSMDPNNFIDYLRNGEILLLHQKNLRAYHARQRHAASGAGASDAMPELTTPRRRGSANSGSVAVATHVSWRARDYVSTFIQFCRVELGVKECVMFETEDLVGARNEKHVVLTLLEVARHGVRWGMPPPTLVRLELEIERELSRDESLSAAEATTTPLDPRPRPTPSTAADAVEEATALHRPVTSCEKVTSDVTMEVTPLQRAREASGTSLTLQLDRHERPDEVETVEEKAKPLPSPPPPPQADADSSDMKNVDRMVCDLVRRCECPSQFPIRCMGPGKYRIGDSQILIFVRILRSHVMVRVGGGWDTLEHYLNKHDPCRKCANNIHSQSSVVAVNGGDASRYASRVSLNQLHRPQQMQQHQLQQQRQQHHRIKSATYTLRRAGTCADVSSAPTDLVLGTVIYSRESSGVGSTNGDQAAVTVTPVRPQSARKASLPTPRPSSATPKPLRIAQQQQRRRVLASAQNLSTWSRGRSFCSSAAAAPPPPTTPLSSRASLTAQYGTPAAAASNDRARRATPRPAAATGATTRIPAPLIECELDRRPAA